MATGAGEGSRLELEVGDIARGHEMRTETSPVQQSTKRDKNDVIIAVCRRQKAVPVVGLQLGAKPPDRKGIGERQGGHLVEEEESREEAGLNEKERKEEDTRGGIPCLR